MDDVRCFTRSTNGALVHHAEPGDAGYVPMSIFFAASQGSLDILSVWLAAALPVHLRPPDYPESLDAQGDTDYVTRCCNLPTIYSDNEVHSVATPLYIASIRGHVQCVQLLNLPPVTLTCMTCPLLYFLCAFCIVKQGSL